MNPRLSSRSPLGLCLLLLLLLALARTAARAGEAQNLRLVPFPKTVELQPGTFSLAVPLILEISSDELSTAAVDLNQELSWAGLRLARIRTIKSSQPVFRLAHRGGAGAWPPPPSQTNRESYALEIRDGDVICTAHKNAGLFYGLQTLRQLIRANLHDRALPCLKILDWPSLSWRAFQDDMTRGPSSTLNTLQFEAALGSFLKLNLMTYYMEYQFSFSKHPQIGPTNGSLSAAELAALVNFAKPLQLQILGNQQSFGHFGAILQHPEFATVRETPDILTPVREETYQLLDDFYSEICPALPFPWFNVCCDETDGLGAGPAKELAAQIGVGGVYVRHIRRLHDLLRDRHHKRMMMWGDIILQHPKNLQEIPKDTIMLSWGYDPRANFEHQILPFARSGYEFFVCPGVSDWSRILPDFGVALTNIHNFVRDGAKHGALGMINTDWEDDGEALKAVKWHADAWAAECAWNASTTGADDFQRRVGAVLFGEKGDRFGRAIERLSQTHRLPPMKNMFNSRFWEGDFVPKVSPVAVRTAATNLLALVRPAIADLEACRREALCNQHLLDVFLFGARRMELIGQRMLDGIAAVQAYARAVGPPANLESLAEVEQLVRTNRDAYAHLGRQFVHLWLSESKPYALDWTTRRYAHAVGEFDQLLARLSAARAAGVAHQPLPSPEAVGLALPEFSFRRVKPDKPAAETLAATMPWMDAAATHRLGLTVQAGAADRFDLPVEVELTLPPKLTAGYVRAFLLSRNGHPHEVLAQLETLNHDGKARLILLLDESLPRGSETSLHIYLGLPSAPTPLAGAVTTAAGANNTFWLENDQVRLLLGREGAHVYRWEIKSLGNRDLTMPGESDWAGFADVNSRRHNAYELVCKARGPAMVEYECTDTWGDTKVFRLYGHSSWMETWLAEPSTDYWNFDDPKNFSMDGPTPGTRLFSNGRSGAVGLESDGVPAQVKVYSTTWGMKFNADKLALGLITPGQSCTHIVAPGAGAGGVGIENSPPTRHFVTFGGVLTLEPAETMNRLQSTLNLQQPIKVAVHALETRRND